VDLSTSRGFMAFVLIESDPQRPTGTIVRRMSRFSEVLAVYETAGKWDVVVKVDTESPERFNDVIESIRLVNGVIDTETITVLKIS
jgi:DNA-binding Lrp family transcriptional regulator